MDMSQYAPDTVQRLYELMSQQFGDMYHLFAAFPLTPPIKTEMPCIIIDRKTDGATIGPTSTDEVVEVIDVIVLKSLADIVGSSDPRVDGKRQMEMLVQGQDPTTLDYKADTLYYVLRHYLTLLQSSGSIWLIDSNVQTAYDVGRLQDGITDVVMAQIRLSTQRRVIVQGRQ